MNMTTLWDNLTHLLVKTWKPISWLIKLNRKMTMGWFHSFLDECIHLKWIDKFSTFKLHGYEQSHHSNEDHFPGKIDTIKNFCSISLD